MRANALVNSPRAMPRIALPIASAITSKVEAGDVEAERSESDRGGDQRLEGRDGGERDPVTSQQVEFGERHRHQSFERASGALAQHRDRGDEEHRDEGEQSDERTADYLERPGLVLERVFQDREQQWRHYEQHRDRSRVAT